MTAREHLRKYGNPETEFDGVSWIAYIHGYDGYSYSVAEDPHEDEAVDALLEQLERKIWAFCIVVEERNLATKLKK